jgi:hypothetical protein
MKKKPPGLYANIHAKRERGEEMRKPGEEGAPSASDFKNAAKTAKKKKNAKRQDPKGNPAGYYDKEGCKECGGGKKPCRCGKKDMGRSGPYADGYGKKCDAIAEEFNGILINDAERADKPCGNSYIPETAKCSKGRGTAKASMKSLKKRALAKEQEVNKGRSVAEQKRRENVPKDKEYKQLRQLENEMNKEQAQSALSDMQKRKAIRKVAAERLKGVKTEKIKAALKANKGNKSLEGRTMQKAAKRELFNRGAQTALQSALVGYGPGLYMESRRNKKRS